MKNIICILLALAFTIPAFAARKQYSLGLGSKSGQQLYKEMTGHCYYNETVQKTKIGWKSTAEMSRMSDRQIQFIKVPRAAVNSRKVYVAKSYCSSAGKSALRMRR